jgi:allantoate deiminase
MDARLCALAQDAIRGIGIKPLSMVSGAGHDAMILAERVPSTMIFLRSPGGISHHPDESVRPEDVRNALAAGLAFLRNFDSCCAPPVDKEQSTPHV